MLTSKGIPIVPLYQAIAGTCNCRNRRECGRAGKHPRPRRGFNAASADSGQIGKWMKAKYWENSNWGAKTGRESGLVALDFDHRSGGLTTYAELVQQHPEVENTVMVNSGGGRHLWFKHPGGTISSQTDIRNGVDVRGDGGMIIVPPSIHANGSNYQWVHGHSIQQIALAPMPPVLTEWINSNGRKREVRSGALRCDTGHTHDNTETLLSSVVPKVVGVAKGARIPQGIDSTVSEPSVGLDSLSAEMKEYVSELVAASVPAKIQAGKRNALAFELARRLRWGQLANLDIQSRRAVFAQQFHLIVQRGQACGVSVQANIREHIADAERGFQKSHTPLGGQVERVLEHFETLYKSDEWPPAVLNAINENYIDRDEWDSALVLLCWAFHEVQGNGVWFGGFRQLQQWLGRVIPDPPHQESVHRAMKWLCDSKIIRMVKTGDKGTIGKKKASEWLWTWVPSSDREHIDAGIRDVFRGLFRSDEVPTLHDSDGGDEYYGSGF